MKIQEKHSYVEKENELLEGETMEKLRAISAPAFIRVEDRNNQQLVEVLLSLGSNERVSFIPVKTSQAEFLYNDEMVLKFFEFRMWFSASEDDQSREMNHLRILIQGVLAWKRFLLVLDDVWKDKQKRDMFLQTVSVTGGYGSKILLATPDTKLMDIPVPVLMNIFSRLPVRSVIACKCVCKNWKALTSDPEFQKLHFARAPIVPMLRTFEPRCWPRELHLIEANNAGDLTPPLKLYSKLILPKHTTSGGDDEIDAWIPKFGIVNSCNGLLCVCSNPFNNPIYICNPITGDYIMLPQPIRTPLGNYIMVPGDEGQVSFTGFVVSGFGFSSKDNQYKVMRIVEFANKNELVVQVHTLGSNSWREIGKLSSWKESGLRVSSRQNMLPKQAPYKPSFPVYLNGAIHYICNRRACPWFIDSFNFEAEKFYAIPPPPHFGVDQKLGLRNMRLGVLGGCLCVSDVTSYTKYELWVMKEYKVQDSWVKEFVIDTVSLNIWPRGLYRPIKYLENGDLLMFHPSNALVCYDPREKSFRYFKIHGIDSDFELIAHTPSLIPMKDALVLQDNLQVQIFNSRYCEKHPTDWEEYEDFGLVEENEAMIWASYVKKVEENSSFGEAFTSRHWN